MEENVIASKRFDESGVLSPLTFVTQDENGHQNRNKNITCLKCLKCKKYYVFPEDKDTYLTHLFLDHRLVIADIEDIPLLEEYLKYWENEFLDHELDEYCTTMLLDQLPDGKPAKNEKYYLLSDILPKDYDLRKRLEKQRLQQVLAQYQFECTDRSFNKECLYCRDVITGLRAEYLEHLFNKHFLQLGKPENLVFVDELLAKVQANLENLICLFCEKKFKDRVTLKEHMRKKSHKRINPNNLQFDKYFLIHYRKEDNKKQGSKKIIQNRHLGAVLSRRSKNLDTVQVDASDRSERESVSEFERRFGGHGEDSDSDWYDWDGEQLQPLNCLFCLHEETNFSKLKEHMLHTHCLDFEKVVQGLNFYQKIKIVNYVRRQMHLLRCVNCDLRYESLELLLHHMKTESHFGIGCQRQWDKPEYFFPTYEDDGLLCVLDDNTNDNSVEEDSSVRIFSEDPIVQINKDAERLSLEKFNFSEIGL